MRQRLLIIASRPPTPWAVPSPSTRPRLPTPRLTSPVAVKGFLDQPSGVPIWPSCRVHPNGVMPPPPRRSRIRPSGSARV